MRFSASFQLIFYTEYLDYQNIGLIVVIWNLMVFDEPKVNVRIPCTKSQWWRKNLGCCCKTVAVDYSFMKCHCGAYAKTNYPGRYIVLSFRQMKNVRHYCERLLMVTLLWIVVIHLIIFQMIPDFFWCIANEVKYWRFYIFARFYTRFIYWLNMSFAHHICCCFVVFNHFNCFVEQNSQLDRFLMWHVLIVDYCVK